MPTNDSFQLWGNVIVLFLRLHFRSSGASGYASLSRGQVGCQGATASLIPEGCLTCCFASQRSVTGTLKSSAEAVSYLQAAKRGLRKVRPSRWINLMLSFLSTTSLLSESCLSSIDCRTLGAGEEGSVQSQIIQSK